jgi:hypothetical protein
MSTKSFAARNTVRVGTALCVLTLIASTAVAQNQKYQELPAHPSLKTWSSVVLPSPERREVENMLRGESSLDAGKFDAFFNTAVFPQFTLQENIFSKTATKSSKTNVCKLPDMRKDFKTTFYKLATNQQARDHLNSLTLNVMTKIAGGNFHPLARYNAMMLIAELNEDEATEAPYKPALRILDIAAHHKALSDSVHVAALIGIVRHAKSEDGLDAASKNKITENLKQLVNNSKPPAGRSREGHDWMRRRALEGLVAIYVKDGPPKDGSFVSMLGNLLAETDSTMELRAEAAEALLTVNIVAPAKFDSAKMAGDIGQVAVDAYHRELDTSLRLGRKIYADGMNYYFTLVDRALSALDKAVPSPKIATLQTALATLSESTIPEEPDDPDIVPDPFLQENKLYDAIAQSGAKFEALVTGKPENEILPKRDPAGGNTGAVGGGGYGAAGYGATGGYGSTGRSGYGSTGRGGYGTVPPAAPSRGGYGAYGGSR